MSIWDGKINERFRLVLVVLLFVTIAIVLTALAVTNIGCASVSKDGRTFYGWGKAQKDAEGNSYVTESTPPITLPKVEI